MNQIFDRKSTLTPQGPEFPSGRVHSVRVALAAEAFGTAKLDEKTRKTSKENAARGFTFFRRPWENMYYTAWVPRPTVKEFSPSRKIALANLRQR